MIVYYSGWLQKPELAKRGVQGFDINDSDKNGFMAAINGLDRAKGLDLVLHTSTRSGLTIVDIEKPDTLQDAILTVHHACVLTLQSTAAFKIIENQLGTAHILLAQPTIQVAS